MPMRSAMARRLMAAGAAVLCFLWTAPVWAQAAYPDVNGVARQVPAVVMESLNGSGNAVPDSATNPHPVAASGYDSGAVTAAGTVNSSSHSAGQSVGGLISVPIARIAGGSGIITNFSWTSPGGATVQYVVRVWQKNPASTTCTDNSAFAGNANDDKNLIVPPFAITPAAPASTTGDAKTYAAVTGVTWDYKNVDTSPGQNLYVCVVTTATDTADESTSPVVMLSGPQN